MEVVARLQEILPEAVKPEIVLPSQLNQAKSASASSGEGKLLAAVLLDAVHQLLGNMHPTSTQQRLAFAEARYWIMNHENSPGLFSYESVCGLLGINADRLRRELRRRLNHNDQTPARTSLPSRRAAMARAKTPADRASSIAV